MLGEAERALLRLAADVIEERGLYKGAFAASTYGPVCAWGALRVAATGSPFEPSWAADSIGYSAVQEALGDSLICWNDDPRRTVDDVIALFRKLGAE